MKDDITYITYVTSSFVGRELAEQALRHLGSAARTRYWDIAIHFSTLFHMFCDNESDISSSCHLNVR